MDRYREIRFKVSEDIYDRLSYIAKGVGLSANEMARFIIGSEVRKHIIESMPIRKAVPKQISELDEISLQSGLKGSRFEKFTVKAREVLGLAEREAQKCNNDVEPEHILIALTLKRGCLAKLILDNLDVDSLKLRRAIDSHLMCEPMRQVDHITKLSSRAKYLMELTVNEARLFNHNYVGTEHLLLGLLRESGLACEVLQNMGVTLDKVSSEITRIISGAKEK